MQSFQAPYSKKELMGVVLDVEAYPQFIKYCKNAHIDMESENKFQAGLHLQYRSFKIKFASQIKCEDNSITVTTQDLKVPFSLSWHFYEEAHEEGNLDKQGGKSNSRKSTHIKIALHTTSNVYHYIYKLFIHKIVSCFAKRLEELTDKRAAEIAC